MTGIEAISDGVPAFKAPESRNAAQTLVTLGVLLSIMFLGISFLADHIGREAVEHRERPLADRAHRVRAARISASAGRTCCGSFCSGRRR